MSALYVVQKYLLALLLPPASPTLAILAGSLLARTKWLWLGRCLFWTGLICLYGFSLTPVAGSLIKPLEGEFAPLDRAPGVVDAVVVLTGGTRDVGLFRIGPVPDSGGMVRLVEGIRHQRGLQDVPLVICGGRADPSKAAVSFGEAMLRQAMKLGVKRADVLLEDGSYNTLEGAKALKGLLSPRGEARPRIILVTSAFHMGRSVRFFQRQGFQVVPAPTDFLSEDTGFSLMNWIPSAAGMGVSATAVYEYLVRSWYAMTGKA